MVSGARVEEAHRACCCLHLRAAVRMYRTLAEEAVAELRRIEGQEGAENAPSRAADGLAGSGWHSGTPATGEARKSTESDADDDAEWDAREAIERARGGR